MKGLFDDNQAAIPANRNNARSFPTAAADNMGSMHSFDMYSSP